MVQVRRVEVASEAGIVALADSHQPLPHGLDQDALLRHLEPLSRSGALFFLVADDPVRFRIDIADHVLPGVEQAFEPVGGVLALDTPSGRGDRGLGRNAPAP